MQWPWIHRTVWQKIRSFSDHILHRQKWIVRSRSRKIVLTYLFFVLLLTSTMCFTYFSDLRAFSYTEQVFVLSSSSSPYSELSNLLTSTYHSSDWGSLQSRFYIWSIIIFVLLTTFTSLYLSLYKISWQIHFIFKRLGLFLVFQFAYFLPLMVLVFVPEFVTQNLFTTATDRILVARQEIIKSDPDSKLITNTEDITKELTTLTAPPLLLTGNTIQKGMISYLNLSSPDTFYRAIILPSLIYQTEISDLGHSAILFPNHDLFISPTISQAELAHILTALSLKMYALSPLSHNFQTKTTPMVKFLAESEYIELENKKAQLEQKRIEEYLVNVNQEIVNNNQYLTQLEADLSSVHRDKIAYENRVTPLLAECRTLYDALECETAATTIKDTVDKYNTAIKTIESNLAIAQANIPLLNQAQSNAKVALDKFLSFPVTPELQSGIFEPPQTILIKYTSGLTPANYYYTLLHELAHYYSYHTKASLPIFLEEGITDYIALKSGQPTLSTAKIDGYPDEMQIVHSLILLLGEDQVIKLYFDKSTISWANLIDSKCGKGCYKKLVSLGEQLTYTDSDNHEARDNLVASAKNLLTL